MGEIRQNRMVGRNRTQKNPYRQSGRDHRREQQSPRSGCPWVDGGCSGSHLWMVKEDSARWSNSPTGPTLDRLRATTTKAQLQPRRTASRHFTAPRAWLQQAVEEHLGLSFPEAVLAEGGLPRAEGD